MRATLFALVACAEPQGRDRAAPDADADADADTDADSDADTVVDTATGVRVETVPGAPCADPSAREATKFEVTTLPYVETTPWLDVDGSGVGIGDFDRDGDLDALVLGRDREEYVEQRAPGDFVLREGGYKDPSLDLSQGFGAAVADYDADGDLDVFVTRYGRPNALLQNDGSAFFTDVAVAAGVAGADDHRSAAATFSDFDGDGDLDLVVAGHANLTTDESFPSYLYVNDGDGTFTDASDRLPQELHDAYSFVPLFLDLDGDGWRDLFVANDLGGQHVPSMLLWNEGGTFVLDGNASHLDVLNSAMGIGVGDLDEDGVWDLVIPAWDQIMALYSAYGVWFESSAAIGLVPDTARNQVIAWGTVLADLDLDTRLDVPVPFGQLQFDGWFDSPADQHHGVWMQQPDGSFVDEAAAWQLDDTEVRRGMGIADLDHDGWLDLVLPSHEGPTRIFRANCGTNGWLEVVLSMPGTANLDAVGAEVDVRFDGRTLRRPILAGGTGYGTGLPPVAHFGLGGAEVVDEIVVHWPDGATSVLSGVPASTRVTIVRDSDE